LTDTALKPAKRHLAEIGRDVPGRAIARFQISCRRSRLSTL